MNAYKGSNFESVKDMNRTMLIRLIKKYKTCTRAELAKSTGLTPAAITKIINNFIEWGLVVEVGYVTGEKGRRSIGLQFNAENYYFIGVRLTRKAALIGLFDITGSLILEEKVTIIADEGPRVALDSIKDKVNEILDENHEKSILAIGVAVPGPYFPKEGKMDKLSGFPEWEEISLKKELKTAFSIPTVIVHDANAGALAEWWIGDTELHSGTMVYLAVGQGIGAGIIENGSLYLGGHGTAGEVGHTSICFDGPKCTCGNKGCLELYASTTALLNSIRQKYPEYPDTMLPKDFTLEDIADAVKKKDVLANSVLDDIAVYLGIGIVNIICVYSPNLIVLGDEIALFGDEFITRVKKVVSEHTIQRFSDNVMMQLSSFERDPAFIGSAAAAIDHALNNPGMFKVKMKEKKR